MTAALDRPAVFRQLHERGCFVMPNPWDAGSAHLLEGLGFPALATTSSGFAWSQGRSDNHVSLDAALRHFEHMARTVAVPVNGDFESGFAREPEGVRRNVTRACRSGIAGLSIEDYTVDRSNPLYEFELAVDRVRAARAAIDESGTGIVLTARSEGFIVGRPDLRETIRRLANYAEAGADCLYAPGIRSKADIAAVVSGVSPKPVNVLVGGDFMAVADLAALGVRRISVGGALARVGWSAVLGAAREIAERGTFAALGRAIPFADIDALFAGARRDDEA